jgi:predicted SAM-dependent methyltransferase
MAIKLDIACGDAKREGYIGIDQSPNSDADIIRDIEKECLPFCDCSIDAIFSKHTLEHINNIIFVMNEFWRVLKPNSELEISVPHKDSQNAVSINHVRFWDESCFDFFRQERSMKLYGLKGIWNIEEMVTNERKDMYVRMTPIKINKIHIKINKIHNHEIRLDVGCGRAKDRNKIGLDIDDYGQEIIWDIRNGMPFCDNECNEIKAYSVLEHFNPEELEFIMKEFHRVLRKDGDLDVCVPVAGTDGAIRDPSHQSLWNAHKFCYFLEGTPKYYNYLPNHKWKQLSLSEKDGIIKAVLTPIKK